MTKIKTFLAVIVGLIIVGWMMYFQSESNSLQKKLDSNAAEFQELFTQSTTTGVAPFTADVYQSDLIIQQALASQQSTQPATATH